MIKLKLILWIEEFKKNYTDNRLYKTSDVRRSTLFKLNIVTMLIAFISLTLLWYDAELSIVLLLIAYNINILQSAVYKEVADNMEGKTNEKL